MDRAEYTRRLEFEHELIGRQIGWLLTSQTILLTAYGFVISNPNPATAEFKGIIPIVATVVSVAVLFGVVAAFLAKLRTWQDFKAHSGNTKEPFGVRTHITYIGLVPDFALPLVFAIAWPTLT
jgi:hypothetical protein